MILRMMTTPTPSLDGENMFKPLNHCPCGTLSNDPATKLVLMGTEVGYKTILALDDYSPLKQSDSQNPVRDANAAKNIIAHICRDTIQATMVQSIIKYGLIRIRIRIRM